ncbi:MAG TPA: 2-oxoglutarate dehydrogenase, E2 component, dihydrolipoamide succinyltransferase [Egibacteraceae bacterium]|nr:2-oxoglutarate dehydrogenase, E2 component, dihydrolipoamide succinyltransferase [Egibacteraceae bacterium]
MATEVTLPQLGESVTEGTITAWLVGIGEEVQADQPLFELSSDKIDTEVPAPTSGVLKEIRVDVDETVDVGTVVAIIAEAGEDTGGAQATGGEAAAPQGTESADGAAQATPPADAPGQAQERPAAEAPAAAAPAGQGNGETQLMSPIVRRMVAEHGIDVSQVSGSGQGGRITREDVEAAISGQGGGQAAAPSDQAAPARAPQRSPQPARRISLREGERERVEDLSRIRQRIAAKMMESMSSSAQLTTVQEADVTRVMRLRERVKEEFKAREGVSLSPFVFLARAAVLAIRRHELVNAQADWDAGKVKIHGYVNLGIAVDTPKGLLVPNVKGADDLTLAGLARGIKEAADKARGDKKLEMQDIEGGTFTVTNTGSRGVLLDTPILNYPEVAILATGAIQKRPVVVTDDGGEAIAIRDMVYLCLTYDHRLIDGADAARFVSDVAEVVETHDWAGEIRY